MDFASSFGYLCAALVVSIIVPAVNNLFSTLIKSWHEQKMKRIDLYDVRRLDRIELYVNSVSQCVRSGAIPDSFADISSSIFLYIPESLYQYVDDINSCIHIEEYDYAAVRVREFCSALADLGLLSAVRSVERKYTKHKPQKQK